MVNRLELKRRLVQVAEVVNCKKLEINRNKQTKIMAQNIQLNINTGSYAPETMMSIGTPGGLTITSPSYSGIDLTMADINNAGGIVNLIVNDDNVRQVTVTYAGLGIGSGESSDPCAGTQRIAYWTVPTDATTSSGSGSGTTTSSGSGSGATTTIATTSGSGSGSGTTTSSGSGSGATTTSSGSGSGTTTSSGSGSGTTTIYQVAPTTQSSAGGGGGGDLVEDPIDDNPPME